MSRAEVAAGRGLRPSKSVDIESASPDILSCSPARVCGICTISCCALLNFALAVAALSIGITAFMRENPIKCVPLKDTFTLKNSDHPQPMIGSVAVEHGIATLKCVGPGPNGAVHRSRIAVDQLSPTMNGLSCGHLRFPQVFAPESVQTFLDSGGVGELRRIELTFAGNDLGEDICYQPTLK